MRKMLLAVMMVVSGGGMLLLFCLVQLVHAMPPGIGAEKGMPGAYPVEVPETPLWVLQLTEYSGPFLEQPGSQETVRCAAVLIENRGGLYISAGAVILHRQEEQLVFELRDLPPGAQTLVLEKDAQVFTGAVGWRFCGWVREEYPEQWGWLQYEQLPGGLAVTNISDQGLPVVELTYKRRSKDSEAYVGGVSFQQTIRALLPGETRILPLPHYGQDRIQVVKTIVYYED